MCVCVCTSSVYHTCLSTLLDEQQISTYLQISTTYYYYVIIIYLYWYVCTATTLLCCNNTVHVVNISSVHSTYSKSDIAKQMRDQKRKWNRARCDTIRMQGQLLPEDTTPKERSNRDDECGNCKWKQKRCFLGSIQMN